MARGRLGEATWNPWNPWVLSEAAACKGMEWVLRDLVWVELVLVGYPFKWTDKGEIGLRTCTPWNKAIIRNYRKILSPYQEIAACLGTHLPAAPYILHVCLV